MFPTKFRFIWTSGCRGEDLKKLTNQKQELPMVAMLANGFGHNEQSLQRTFYTCCLPSFGSFGEAVLKEKIFQKLTNQKQELPVAAMFIKGSGLYEQSFQRTLHRCFLPSFGSFEQVLQRRRFLRNQPIRNKNCLWWPCLVMDRDVMGNRYRGSSIDAFYQVSVHLVKRFQRKRFQKSANQKQELPVVAMFVNGSGQNVQSL